MAGFEITDPKDIEEIQNIVKSMLSGGREPLTYTEFMALPKSMGGPMVTGKMYRMEGLGRALRKTGEYSYELTNVEKMNA
jgi:hypothetical protein